jgi:protoheme IX farnesyltransferase
MTRAVAAARSRAADLFQLTKPGVVLMVLLTTAAGFYLGSASDLNRLAVYHTLIGTAMAAAGALALNQFLERDLDARMARTRNRPLADGRLDPTRALGFATLTTAAGILYLTMTVNALSALLTSVTVLSYLFIYTPLKKRTPMCSVVGALPGALPPLVGMAGARGELRLDSWVLFAILFLWQIPHSLAVARLHRDDYARAGVCFLPVVDRDGQKTGAQAVASCVALLVVALLPTVIGLAGALYFLGALTLGLGFLGCSVALAFRQRPVDANRLLFASLLYLPALLTLMAFNKGPM